MSQNSLLLRYAQGQDKKNSNPADASLPTDCVKQCGKTNNFPTKEVKWYFLNEKTSQMPIKRR